MSDDPIQGMLDRARAELKAINQQTTAAQANLRAIESAHAELADRVEALQKQAAKSAGAVKAAQDRAAAIVNAAYVQATRFNAASMDSLNRRQDEANAAHELARDKAKSELDAITKRVAEAQDLLKNAQAARDEAKRQFATLKAQALQFAQSR